MERRATLLALVVVLSTAVAVPAAATPSAVAAGAADASSSGLDGCEYPFEATDATNTQVRIDEEPRRVVSMAPSAAQTMWEIGGRDKVVGVSQYAAYLDGASGKANISAPGFGVYNVERIVSLQPDVVLAPNVIPNASVERIRSAGVTVFKFEAATSITDVRSKTELIGRLTGQCEGAADAVAWMDRNLQAVEAAVADREPARALYMLGGGFTTGSGTFVHDMITAAGATNVMAEAGVSGFGVASEEVVLNRDPEYLLVTDPNSPYPGREPYASTTAVQQNNVLILNGNYMSQPAPRSVVYGVRNMTERFHPSVFGPEQYVSREEAAANPTTATPTATETDPDPTATETATPTETETAQDTTVDSDPTGETVTGTMDPTGPDGTTTDGSGQGLPGFGTGVAAVAVAIAVLVLARRRT